MMHIKMMAQRTHFFSFGFIVIGLIAGVAGVYFMKGLEKGESDTWGVFCAQGEVQAVPLSCVHMDKLMRRYARMTPEEATRELDVLLSDQDLEINDGTTVLLYYLAYRSGQSAVPLLTRFEKSGDKQRGDFLLAAVQGWADRNLDAAAEFIQANKQDLPMLLTVLVDTVNQKVKTHPDETAKWISTLDRDTQMAAWVQFMNGVYRYHPGQFHSYVKKIDPACFRDFRLCSLIAERGVALDSEVTQDWINTLSKSQKKYVLSIERNKGKVSSAKGKNQATVGKEKKEEDIFFFDYMRHNYIMRRNLSWK